MHVLESSSLFSKNMKLALLVGAGISLDTPSNLLDGYTFMSQVLQQIKLKDISDEWILAGLQRSKEGLSRPGEFLRFELMMKALQDSGLDEDLHVLDCLADCDRPNRGHFITADLLHGGCTVLTTNFDCLIEHAYQQLNPGNWPPLRVVIYDEEFSCAQVEQEARPTLWKLHGSLKRNGADTRDSLEATMTAVLARTQDGNKYRFLADILKTMDLLVLGYSGWDDFDIVPILAETRSDRRLIWVEHNDRLGEPQVSDGTEVLAEMKQNLHIGREADVVGRDRIFFNIDPNGSQVRDTGALMMIRGLTSNVLDELCATRLSHRSYPTSRSEFAFGRKYAHQVELYFQNWAAKLISLARTRYAFIESAFQTRIDNRYPEIGQLIEAQLAKNYDSEPDSIEKRLRQLVDRFNAGQYIYPPNAIQANQLAELSLQAEILLPDLSTYDAVVALRLLGCINYKLEGSQEGDEYFRRSAELARAHHFEDSELQSLLDWRTFWRSSFGEGNQNYSIIEEEIDGRPVIRLARFPEERVDARIRELENATGYLPLVASDELRNDLAIYLEEYDIPTLLQRTRRLRRHAVDVGDLRGEAQCSLRLAHLLRNGGEWIETAIELLRLEELEALLEEPVPRYLLLEPLGSWDSWISANDREDLYRRVRASMWGVAV